ncbi:MAG TPA: hypothetical protein VF937_11580, partial [Chloroflexota bacterium]
MLLRRLHRDIPEPPVDEPRLLHEVSATGDSPAYTALTNGFLQRLSAERGVDFATALLYDRVRRSAEHGQFIHDVESLDLDLARLPRLRGTVLLVPAPFYRELPEFGGDGRLMRQVARAFGLRVGLVPVPSVGSVRAGAEAVRRAVTDCVEAGATPVVLVSLSKGSADVRVALESGLPTAAVAAWVQVCGLVRGSPWVNRILSAWPDRLLLAGFLGLAGGRP